MRFESVEIYLDGLNMQFPKPSWEALSVGTPVSDVLRVREGWSKKITLFKVRVVLKSLLSMTWSLLASPCSSQRRGRKKITNQTRLMDISPTMK
jgi:hypothetical protein